ncbi:MAG: tRNA adenosine(34) deaminase TadA [Clostridia bacterium]|nr:tRNA adenosine(34) deaminase TadA [Clostridia bacterium]
MEERLSDEYFMSLALEEARAAEALDEAPIGCVIVKGGQVIAKAHNMREHNKCATHHAEVLAIEEACRALGGWRLPGVTLYVTMEPCCMCAGAIVNARVERVVYGAPDLRFGAMGSLFDITRFPLNHIPECIGGVMRDECVSILSGYFKKKRKKDKTENETL